MSALTPTVTIVTPVQMPHPWRRLRELADVTLRWHQGGPMGWTHHASQTISLREGMTYEERRCSIQHELLHIGNGPQPLGLAGKEEESVRRETARIMLPNVRMVGEALAWSHTLEEAAYELDVDIYVLRKRLRHLHPAERAYLKQRLEYAEVP